MSDTGAQQGLPTELNDITPAWLTRVLQGRFAGVVVEDVRLGEQNWGTASSTRLHLTIGDDAGHAVPGTVYLKGGFDDVWRKRAWMAIQAEAVFYRDVAENVDLNLLDHYFVAHDNTPQGIVLLEDINGRGGVPGDQAEPISTDRVALILESVAKMHADWWDNPRSTPYVKFAEPQRTMLKWLVRPTVWEELTSRKHGKRLERLVGSAETAQRALETLWSELDSQPRTLLHGDLHTGNIFWEESGDPGFIDWQCFFAGSYVHDVSWIIVTALETSERRDHEAELVRLYLDVLKSHMGDAPSFDETWLRHRQSMAHALASYGATPKNMFSLRRTEAREDRVYAAAEDLEVLQALDLEKT